MGKKCFVCNSHLQSCGAARLVGCYVVAWNGGMGCIYGLACLLALLGRGEELVVRVIPSVVNDVLVMCLCVK